MVYCDHQIVLAKEPRSDDHVDFEKGHKEALILQNFSGTDKLVFTIKSLKYQLKCQLTNDNWEI